MAKNIEMGVRSMIASKQSQIKIVDGREPSLKELAEDKPVMRMVPGKGLIMYVRHGNQRYHMKFSSDPRQLGRVRVEDIEPDPLMGTKLLDDDVLPVIPSSKGGLGDDFSGTATGFIRMINGTATQRTYANAKSDLSLNLVANVDQTDADNISSGTLAKAQGGFGADASTVSVALITDNLEAGGLKTGRTIGDAVKKLNIYNGSNRATIAGNSDDDAPSADLYWQQSDTTWVKKIEFNYVHDVDIQSLALFCNLYSDTFGETGYARLVIYEIVAGGTSPIAASATIADSGAAVDEVSSTSLTYEPKVSGKVNVSGLDHASEEILYRAAIEMKSSHSGTLAFMTGVAVVAWGQ